LSYQNAESTAPARLGRYELLGHLATGGMAEIHLARLAGEAGFEKIVVVKRLLPELVASKAFVAMFLDEGKLVARLDHPNVCEVFELARDGAEYFLVMPFLDGVPATDFIARPREPDRIAQLRVAAALVAQACAGLHHAHELRDASGELAGLVHRDVSPSNLFVTASGVVKVLDFGIAKVRGAAATEVGTVKGKTQYMAPEQLLGEALDRRADVFALGIVLYELATHQRLFKRASDYLAARAILEEPIPRADAADPAIPAALADAIARALERRPADRYADARELAVAIEAALAAHGGIAAPADIAAALVDRDELSAQRTRQARVLDDARARTDITGAAPRATSAAQPPTDVATAVVAHRRSRLPVVLLLGGALLLAATISWLALRDRGDASTPDGSPVVATIASDATLETPADALVAPVADAATAEIDMPVATGHIARGTGWLSIDSKPFATIYVDDKYLGQTPLVHKQLPAGRHRVKAVLADGREKQQTITVRAGKTEPVQLTW
jgi:serine/threonine-protein kinase